jgi:hypothetical protein
VARSQSLLLLTARTDDVTGKRGGAPTSSMPRRTSRRQHRGEGKGKPERQGSLDSALPRHSRTDSASSLVPGANLHPQPHKSSETSKSCPLEL